MKNTTSLETIAILAMSTLAMAYTVYCFVETINIIINYTP